jgi:hypothetical protein
MGSIRRLAGVKHLIMEGAEEMVIILLQSRSVSIRVEAMNLLLSKTALALNVMTMKPL